MVSGGSFCLSSRVIVSVFEYTRHCVDSCSDTDRTLYRFATHRMLAQGALV